MHRHFQRYLSRLQHLATKLLGSPYIPTPPPARTLPPPTGAIAQITLLHSTPLGQGKSLDRLILRFISRYKLQYLLYPFILLWATGFVLLIRQQWYNPSSASTVGCTASIWDDWPPDNCGLNGTDCQGNVLGGPADFRCLGGCDLVRLGNPRWVGGMEIDNVPVVIGPAAVGENIYRADSWICAAAIHAGVISSTYGGGLTLTPLDYPTNASNYTSTTSHSITSTAFIPSYPGAYQLSSIPSTPSIANIDLHWPITAYNVVCLFIMTIFLRPPSWVLFSLLVILGYLQIVLVSDVADLIPDWSGIVGGFPAIAFTAYWMYTVSFRIALEGFSQLPFELALWQGLGYWIGVESSTIFARLPISTLGYGGLSTSGIIEIIVIVLIVVVVLIIQALSFRKHGLLRYYLIRYIPLIPLLIILANLGHGYVLRPHHYLLALLAVPVLSLPNRISIFGGAFCLGLFLDGVGRWGWDSLVESTASLLGDAASGTAQPIFNTTTISEMITWTPLSSDLISSGFTAFSLLVDDIQWTANYTSNNISITDFGFQRSTTHYLRVAFIANGTSQDYTDPVIWNPSYQNWTGPGLD